MESWKNFLFYQEQGKELEVLFSQDSIPQLLNIFRTEQTIFLCKITIHQSRVCMKMLRKPHAMKLDLRWQSSKKKGHASAPCPSHWKYHKPRKSESRLASGFKMHLLRSWEEEVPRYLSQTAKWLLSLVKLPSSFDIASTYEIP